MAIRVCCFVLMLACGGLIVANNMALRQIRQLEEGSLRLIAADADLEAANARLTASDSELKESADVLYESGRQLREEYTRLQQAHAELAKTCGRISGLTIGGW